MHRVYGFIENGFIQQKKENYTSVAAVSSLADGGRYNFGFEWFSAGFQRILCSIPQCPPVISHTLPSPSICGTLTKQGQVIPLIFRKRF